MVSMWCENLICQTKRSGRILTGIQTATGLEKAIGLTDSKHILSHILYKLLTRRQCRKARRQAKAKVHVKRHWLER